MSEQRTGVVVACGRWPSIGMVRKLIDRADLLIACDGALTVCEEHGIQVDVLVGDMDSVEQHHLDAYLERGGTLIERPNQHANDLTKALVYLEEQGVESCTVLGATGGDRQHEWANLLSCAASSLEITCVGTANRYEFLKTNKKYAIELVPGEEFSLFALPAAFNIQLAGAAFPLDGATLEMGSQGLHNVAVQDTVEISFNEGRLMLMRPHPSEPVEGRNEA